MFDRSNQMLCVQEQGKTHYMVFNESKSLYQFIENANRTAKAEDLAYLGANIYVSQDNITYLPINTQVVRNDYGKMLDTDSSTVYCEVEAAVPVGYQYIKIEMTQPLFLATDPSFNSVAPTGERFRTCISRITLNGDSVRIISGQESSSSSSTSSSSTIPQEPRPDRPRKPTEDTTTSLPAEVFSRVGDIDGIGHMIPRAEQMAKPEEASPSNEVLAAETEETPAVTPTQQVQEAIKTDKTTTQNENQRVQYAGQDIKEIVCLIVGAVGVSAATYAAVTMSQAGKRPREYDNAAKQQESDSVE